MLKLLYGTGPGRALLGFLTDPRLSVLCGGMMDAGWSRALIPFFIKENHISLREYEPAEYRSFNEFFSRKIRPECRPVDREPDHLIAPCDGYLTAYPVRRGMVVPVKQSSYSISDLVRDPDLASEYEGGTCLVFRLCVHHYHRYCYPDGAVRGKDRAIPGRLHTVRPEALQKVPVFVENSREYTILHTDHFGDLVQMEVGAMLVGKIHNHPQEGRVERGQEKGFFLYGGSTILLLAKKGRVRIPERVFAATREGREIPVKQGQKIGVSAARAAGRKTISHVADPGFH